MQTTVKVVTAGIKEMCEATQAVGPNYEAMRKVVRRARIANDSAPADPLTLHQLNMPHRYTVYTPPKGTGQVVLVSAR